MSVGRSGGHSGRGVLAAGHWPTALGTARPAPGERASELRVWGSCAQAGSFTLASERGEVEV